MVTLYNDDCLEKMVDLPDKSVDLILCDLPYGTTACKWDVVIPFEPLWEHYNRIIKDNGAIVLFGSEPFSSYLRMSNIKNFKYDWIWQKNAGSNFANVKYQPMKEHETISVFAKQKTRYFPIMQERAETGRKRVKTNVKSNTNGSEVVSMLPYGKTKKYNDLRYPSSIQKFNRERGLHPTQKPVALMEYIIKTYTNEGDVVLDNCMGSGTTGVAAINLNRGFIGIELNEDYFNIASKRIADAIELHKYKTEELF